jgi:transcriptional regulator with XRE-family HTH domain
LNLANSERFSHSIAEALKQLRLEAGVSQEELARKAGVSRTAITMMENKQRNPTVLFCHALCEALDVTFAQVVAITEKPQKRKGR